MNDQTRWKVTKEDGEFVIHGKYGVISQFKDGDIDLWVKRPIISGRIERNGWKALNHYDDGACFIRPLEDLDKACHWIKARKKRVVTEAMRIRGRELAARIGFGKKNHRLGEAPEVKS